jgi:hypothetical protein
MLNKDTRDLFILCIYACASYSFIIVIRYLFICARLFVIVVHLFCSLFDYLFVCCFHSLSILCLLFKRENNNSDPELCSDIFFFFFPIYFLGFCVYCIPLPPLRGQHMVLCHPRWLPTAGLTEFAMCWEELDSNPGLLICSQVRYH